MMSDSQTNRPTEEEERLKLYKKLILERYGEWATRPDARINESKES